LDTFGHLVSEIYKRITYTHIPRLQYNACSPANTMRRLLMVLPSQRSQTAPAAAAAAVSDWSATEGQLWSWFSSRINGGRFCLRTCRHTVNEQCYKMIRERIVSATHIANGAIAAADAAAAAVCVIKAVS